VIWDCGCLRKIGSRQERQDDLETRMNVLCDLDDDHEMLKTKVEARSRVGPFFHVGTRFCTSHRRSLRRCLLGTATRGTNVTRDDSVQLAFASGPRAEPGRCVVRRRLSMS
jgi:hypothetical protein